MDGSVRPRKTIRARRPVNRSVAKEITEERTSNKLTNDEWRAKTEEDFNNGEEFEGSSQLNVDWKYIYNQFENDIGWDNLLYDLPEDNPDYVSLVLNQGIDYSILSEFLVSNILNGNVNVVKEILKYDLNPSVNNNEAIVAAVEANNTDITEMLIKMKGVNQPYKIISY